VKLNVGGVFFQTNLSTLMKEKDSLLFSLVTGKLESYQSNDGFFYIDRDGTRFKHILNFLRDGLIPQKVFCDMGEELMIEAKFFEIGSLKKALTLLQSKVDDKSLEILSIKEDGGTNIEGKTRKASRVLNVNPLVNLENKVTEVTERIFQSITKKLDLVTISDTHEYKSIEHGNVADASSYFEIIHEKIDGLGVLFADHFGEDSSKLIKDALADCKQIVEGFSTRDKVVASDIANFQLQLNEAVLKFKDQSISCKNEIKEFVETSLQSAFEKHEDKMEIERIVHSHPALCAFSKSEILQDYNEYKAHLHKFLFETKKRGKINLIYSWKQNGADSFHEICDNEPPTLILVEADNGNIFGGYTGRYWNIETKRDGCIVSDASAFVFSLKNHQSTEPFYKLSNGGSVMLDNVGGPAFGKRTGSRLKAEFTIDEDDAEAAVSGGFRLPPKYATCKGDLENVVLAGGRHFSVENMEVFTIQDV